MKKQLLRFSLIHLALAGLVAAMFAARYLSRVTDEMLGFRFSTCLLHDFLHIYCPFCGGTRALLSLLTGDVIGALRANAAVAVCVPFAVYLDVKAFCRIVGRRPVLPLTRLRLWHFALVFAVFFVVRNLLVLFGIDPTGDFIVASII